MTTSVLKLIVSELRMYMNINITLSFIGTSFELNIAYR